MVDKGILNMDDLVEVWKSPLIPNGPVVVRTSMNDDMKAKFKQFMMDLPTSDPACFSAVQGGDFKASPRSTSTSTSRSSTPVRPPSAADPDASQKAAGRTWPAVFPFRLFEGLGAMAMTATQPPLSERGAIVERHWQELAARRRMYTGLGAVILILAITGSLWFANETNAGKFFDRLPYFFDFVGELVPRDGWEIGRALFDLPSPYDDGSMKFNYPEGRFYLTESFYLPEYVHKMLETVNIALFSTIIAVIFGYALAFLAARNTMPYAFIRWPVRRVMEILRAFPEVVIAGFFLAILSLGPIPAIIAVTVHTIGALGKLFFRSDRECRHASRRRLARCRRQLVRAGLVRFHTPGHAELHELLPAASRNQRARVHHHRRRRRWRDRRSAPAFDRPGP